ncbi:Acetylornithine deacetylase(fragment) [Bradyrhizobium sp. ORS 278]
MPPEAYRWPAGDVILTYVAGELQGGVGTFSLIEQGLRADYFINSEHSARDGASAPR